MKALNRVIFMSLGFVLVITLAGCGSSGGGGGGGGGNPGKVAFNCIDIFNEGQTDGCSPAPAAVTAVAAHPLVTEGLQVKTFTVAEFDGATQVDLGTVSRSSQQFVAVTISNSTDQYFSGVSLYATDMQCGGQTGIWNYFSATTNIDVGSSVAFDPTSPCGDSPVDLGTYHIYATVFEADGITVVDQVVGTFTLVE